MSVDLKGVYGFTIKHGSLLPTPWNLPLFFPPCYRNHLVVLLVFFAHSDSISYWMLHVFLFWDIEVKKKNKNKSWQPAFWKKISKTHKWLKRTLFNWAKQDMLQDKSKPLQEAQMWCRTYRNHSRWSDVMQDKSKPFKMIRCDAGQIKTIQNDQTWCRTNLNHYKMIRCDAVQI